MKKLLLLALLGTTCLVGCGKKQNPSPTPSVTPSSTVTPTVTPTVGPTVKPTETPEPSPTIDPSKDVVVNFYLDYNQPDAKNIYESYVVKNGSKLTRPKTDPTTPFDPAFPVFLGWSHKDIIDDKKDLWDFDNDIVATNDKSWNMYGIWVAEGEF